MAVSYPFKTSAFVVKQTLGDFYLAAIPAEVLLDVSYSHRLKANRDANGGYELEGAQRKLFEPRIQSIGKFINTTEAAFPNSIILAANYREDSGQLEDEDGEAWSLDLRAGKKDGHLIIPSVAKLAAIIDGQHRLFGFKYARKELLQMPLVCSVYFDLPKPYQAFLFATINSNQKPVDKSQTYELFGYNVEDEPSSAWTPDKLAVFLTRKLNTEKDSPFLSHIVIAAENDIVQTMAEAKKAGEWMVSTATVVEGILRLISPNPKNDVYCMQESGVEGGRSRKLLALKDNSPPLRSYFIEGNDTLIHTVVKNYFIAAAKTLWLKEDNGFVQRTVGVQALFDLLRKLLPNALEKKNLSVRYFEDLLKPAAKVDFTDIFFHASGAGRTRVRNCLTLLLGLSTLQEIADADQRAVYKRLTGLK